jgi:glycosyltransferase involved in cell wall biosynthesis
MEKIKVFGLFRIPVSYINPLLEKFSECEDIELKVAFSIKPPNETLYPRDLNYIFLDGAEEAYIDNEHSERDRLICQKSVRQEIENFMPDILFLGTGYLMPTTWLAVSAAKKKRIPIITRMTTEAVTPTNLIKRIAKRIIVGTYCSKMNAGVYECSVQKDYMVKYGMKPEKLFFAPCSVNNEFFLELAQKYSKEEAKRRLGLEKDCFVITDTAELIDRKRPIDLIKAVEILRKEFKIKTFFIGKGALSRQLEDYIVQNDLNECVLCGRLTHEEMGKYLCATDVFVMPSENDASPKALNEAMNFQVAIVVTDGICTARELCLEGINGYIYHAGRVDELTNSLRKILSSPGKILQMGAESKKIVSAFSYDNVIKGWKEAAYSCLK